MPLPVRPPVAPMLAKLVRTLPDGAWIYEPKWDGFRALAFRDGADVDVRSRNDRRRRARLEWLLRGARSPHLMPTPATDDASIARDWLERFGGGGVDGVMVKDPDGRYEHGRRAMVKVKTERTAECVVAGLRHFPHEPVVASLLLGLYDGDRLVHVGVASQFTEAKRRALFAELRRLVTSLTGHPWERGFGLEPSPLGRLHGAAGRWVAGAMEPDWLPLRPERVCEVAFGTVDGARLRYPARFLRWRPDRDARSCTVDQLHAATPDVRALLSA
jgi:ATP-dependent DNA ligase